MKGKQIALLVVAALVLTALLAQTALAGQDTHEGVTVTTPDTYEHCAVGKFQDTVKIRGLTGHNPQATINGTISVSYIQSDGSRKPGNSYELKGVTKNTDVVVQYDPIGTWGVNGQGNPEAHTDVHLVLSIPGKPDYPFGPNPNLGWDVYCSTGLISRTPTNTPTKTSTIQTKTPTLTPTVFLHQIPSVTATPTSKPPRDNSTNVPPTPGAAGTETPTLVGPTPAVSPTTGGTPEANMSALGIIMLIGLGLLGAGLALRRAMR